MILVTNIHLPIKISTHVIVAQLTPQLAQTTLATHKPVSQALLTSVANVFAILVQLEECSSPLELVELATLAFQLRNAH